MKKMAFVLGILALLAGCKKQKHAFNLAPTRNDLIDESILPEDGKPITIFIHGGARPFSSLIPLPGFASRTPKGLTLAKALDSDGTLGKKVSTLLSAADPKMFPRETFYSFGWSGLLSAKSREKAGKELYDVLTHLKNDKRYAKSKITIITYSHGGNVVLNAAIAACARGDRRVLVDLLIMTACPVVVPTQDFISSPTFDKVISLYSKSDSFQVLDPQGLYSDIVAIPCKFFFSKRRFDGNHIIQAEVKINNRSRTGHLGFVTKRFLNALPKIIELLLDEKKRKELPRYKNFSHCVTINTKDNEVTGCKSLTAWAAERRLNAFKAHAQAGCITCQRLVQSYERQSPRRSKARRCHQNEATS